MAADSGGGLTAGSDLTAAEAQAYHKLFMTFTFIYIGIATVAHLLMWAWKPWIQAAAETSTAEAGVRMAQAVMPFLS